MINELFHSVNWLWYTVAVVIVFFLGAVWFVLLFGRAWAWAARIIPAGNGKEVIEDDIAYRMGFKSFGTMFAQLCSTLLLGLVYFMVSPISVWLSILIAVATSAWMKTIMHFEIRNWKRYVTLAAVDIGYFFVSSLIFISFALL